MRDLKKPQEVEFVLFDCGDCFLLMPRRIRANQRVRRWVDNVRQLIKNGADPQYVAGWVSWPSLNLDEVVNGFSPRSRSHIRSELIIR